MLINIVVNYKYGELMTLKKIFLFSIVILTISCAKGGNTDQCGNNLIDGTELCDDGNKEIDDGCNDKCEIEQGWGCTGVPSICTINCGNNSLDAFEECDDGGESITCNSNCTNSECGDGILNLTSGEICDGGTNSATCTPTCIYAGCGDGIHNPLENEECDDGTMTATCNSNCTLSECGDGIYNSLDNEECDDGTMTATCNSNCTLSECGDGIYNPLDNEECDDGTMTAACNSNCTISECGDGIYNPLDNEECDDGDNIDGNDCSNSCLNNIVCEDPLTTTLAGGNGWSGNMFDVVALKDITINKIDGVFDAVAQTVEIYYRTGTYVGNSSSSAGWILLGSTSITGAGDGVVTNLPINFSVPVTQGNRVSFWVTSTNNSMGSGNIYSNGAGSGTLHSFNADIEFYEGVGTQYPLDSTFTDRIFNGTIYYSCN
jgi:cysteine-rich repeat protein